MTRYHTIVLILLLVTADAHAASADEPLEQVMMQWTSRDFDTLRVQINEALTAYQRVGDSRRAGICYLFLGLADAGLGDVQNSRLHFGEATRRLEAVGDYVGAALAYWLFAEHERLQEAQFDHVLALYEKAFAMLERAKSPSAVFSIDALMVVGPIVGLPPAEYEPNATKPETNKPIVLQLLEAFARSGYGAVFTEIGELERAEVELRRAKEEAATFHGRVDPPIDFHIAKLRRRQWRLSEARESYTTALHGLNVLRPVGVLTPKRLKVEVFGDLADVEMLDGRMVDALAWNDRALELVRAEQSPATEIIVLRSRAELLARGGRFGAAENALARASALAEQNRDFHSQVSIDLSSATMNRTRGRYGAAAANLERSLEALAKTNEPFREPAILGNLAMTYALLNADDNARLLLEKARQLADADGRCLDVAAIDLLESTLKYLNDEISLAYFYKAVEQWLRTPDAMRVPGSEHLVQLITTTMGSAVVDPRLPVKTGMLADGMVELLEAGALFSQGREFIRVRELAMKALAVIPNAKFRAGALTMIGGTYVAEGDDDNAIAYFSKAVDALETASDDSRADPLLSTSPRAASWSSPVFGMLLQLLVKHRRYEDAFAIAERARARVFLQMIGNSRVSPKGTENTLLAHEAETLRTQMLQWQQQTRLAPQGQRNEDLRQVRRKYEALMTRVKASNPQYAAMTTVAPLQVEAIRAKLPFHTTLVNYFITPHAAHAWVLERTRFQYVPLPFDPTALARAECAARQFRIGGRGVRLVQPACEPATVDELYEKLFAPLRAHVHNKRLVIVPHGVLHYLPFGSFRDSRTGRYLVDDYTITYAPSASSIHFLRDKETPVKGNSLVIGAPAGVLPELPGAMREATMVGAKLQSAPMVGVAAKESLLYQVKGDVDLVHIAAHGFYEPDTPLFSRLALAAGDGSDGHLEVGEILSDVDLTGVNLVVLSACQTAVGKGDAGDEIVGLTQAMLYAGTPGVISTLWDIGDDAAEALMNDFYDRLLRGDSAADALRHAQLQMLHGPYPDPRQWAAFTLNGDPEGRWNASARRTTRAKRGR